MNDDLTPTNGSRLLIICGSLLMLSLTGLVILALCTQVASTTPFGFVSLLVIFAVSLTLLALVFKWLGLSSSEEAFSLPPGSVRTLLAIGIMVLFVVFGLAFFKTSDDAPSNRKMSDKPIEEQVEAPAAPPELKQEIERYERSGFAVTVSSRGTTGDNPQNAKLKLYKVEHSQPAAVLDMQKQMVTAVVTLLTTVIGFYFGTRTAEGVREKRADPSSPSTDAQGHALETDLQAIEDAWTKLQAEHQALKKTTSTPDHPPGLDAALSALQSSASALSDQVQALRTQAKEAEQDKAQISKARGMIDAIKLLFEQFKQQLAAATLLAKGD